MKLGKLLQYRKWKEEWSKKELATKKQLLAIEADKLRALEKRKAEGQNDFLQWQQGNIRKSKKKRLERPRIRWSSNFWTRSASNLGYWVIRLLGHSMTK